MLLEKKIALIVFKLDNQIFDAIGEVNQFTSLIWPDKFDSFGEFELNAPITTENKLLLKEGHVLWCGGDNAAVIEIIQVDTDEDGKKSYKIKGRTLEMILTSRVILETYTCTNKNSSTAMYEIVDKNCINPKDELRKIPFLECAADDKVGKMLSFQKTGGEVYDALTEISSDSELGFNVLFKPKERKLIFKVIKGEDRTGEHDVKFGSKLVVFSTAMEDILTSSYYSNSQDVKTMAYVLGEGEGPQRKKVTSGDDSLKGFLRKELYIDARDLQSEVQSEDEEPIQIDEVEYESMLTERGNEKLSEHSKTESFEATMRVFGNVQYEYGVDYFKGDKVIIRDEDIGVQVVATITEVSENFGEEYELDITYGYSYPTLIQRVKKQIL